ncbi:MAG: hypothetical protein PVF58_19030 [Candidatus Methanofastidiosia archaeon]|jgi:hypothetical protein
MQNWRQTLQDMAQPLLESADDLTQYYILREIYYKDETDLTVQKLRTSLIEDIITTQCENGSWSNKVYNYQEGTTHQIMSLIDLGVPPKDEVITRAVDYMFTYQADNGPFTHNDNLCEGKASLIPTTAAVMALGRAGLGDDLRVQKACNWLLSWQQKNGSWLSPGALQRRAAKNGYPYCYCGLHATCNTLLGLSAVNPMRKNPAVIQGIDYLCGLYGLKYEIDADVTPPCYPFVTDETNKVLFEGAWFDPRVIPPEVTYVPRDDAERKVEVMTTQHVLGTLSVFDVQTEEVEKGLSRLLHLLKKEDVSVYTLMVIKRVHEKFSSFSFHGH